MPYIYDKEVVVDILKDIVWSLDQIKKRFQTIKLTTDDFIKNDLGLEKLDSICGMYANDQYR